MKEKSVNIQTSNNSKCNWNATNNNNQTELDQSCESGDTRKAITIFSNQKKKQKK